VVAHLTVDERHLQPYGIVHGGVYAAIGEAIASIGAAVNAISREPGMGVVGLDNHTSFLRAATAGTEIVAVALPRHAGRRTQSWEVVMRDGAGRDLAISLVRLLVQPSSHLPGGTTQAGG
jgi:1,4-dihydroxy-2-naphthoyl-CoA hydrolase